MERPPILSVHCGGVPGPAFLQDALDCLHDSELCHLQAEFAAELSYARGAALLRDILPTTGGLSAMSTRNLAWYANMDSVLSRAVLRKYRA